MQLRYTILYVQSVADTLDFYTHAFGLPRKLLHESGDYGELDTGTTTLSFSSFGLMQTLGKTPGQADPKQPVFELAFETDDVQAALQQALAAGATLAKDVEEMPWGQTIAYVTDPNGFLIEICSPVAQG
ncbi:MAG: VOC family protein [Thiothrix sp.]|nr:VOC family protein [Thiothrix sp.]HPQ96060.1 VOC family protein [Thiolinea sp.]